MTTESMIDVSIANGIIDWYQVSQSGIKYALIRSGEGLHDMDPNLDRNVKGCKDNNIIFGLYRVLVPASGDPAGQAKKLIDLSNKYEAQLYPVVDVEKNRALTADEQKIWSKFLKDYLESTTETIVLYTYTAFFPQIKFEGIKNYKIWIANYGAKTTPSMPGYDIYAWQKSCTGKVQGISTNVDISELYQPPVPPEVAVAEAPVVVEEISPPPSAVNADEIKNIIPDTTNCGPEKINFLEKVMPYISMVPWIKNFFKKN
jgi:GH25 family lysozyme M1 (1,4-beta-N-acetylmuramidase)